MSDQASKQRSKSEAAIARVDKAREDGLTVTQALKKAKVSSSAYYAAKNRKKAKASRPSGGKSAFQKQLREQLSAASRVVVLVGSPEDIRGVLGSVL